MSKNVVAEKLRDVHALAGAMGGECDHLLAGADEIDRLEAEIEKLREQVKISAQTSHDAMRVFKEKVKRRNKSLEEIKILLHEASFARDQALEQVGIRGRQIEKLRKMIVKLYVIPDEHVGSLWKCLGMTFDEYFGLNDSMTYLEKLAAFAAGLAPQGHHGPMARCM